MVDLIDMCIFAGPCFAILSTLLAYLYGVLLDCSSLGVFMAAITSIIPGMVTRSMAGSYDYECSALAILVSCFYTFSLSLNDGSILCSVLSAFCYGYMALTWGGYIFVANCIPLYVAVLLVLGHFSHRLYTTYSIWFVVSTILSASIPFIGDKIVKKPEHFAMIIVFAILQFWAFLTFLRTILEPASFSTVVVSSILVFPLALFLVLTISISTGLLSGFSGRLVQLFDPTYTKNNIPMISSVAEHQPPPWGMHFVESTFFIMLFPFGCFLILRGRLKTSTEARFLLLIYGLSTLYFTALMIRIVLVFTPALALISGFGLHRIVRSAFRRGSALAAATLATVFVILLLTCVHSVWFTFYSFSADHIRFLVVTPDGKEKSDDYREGYRWLWENTHRDDVVMSWWDYGYQVSSIGGRGCLADGNTNNFTQIGIIGMAMASQEEVSWRIARMMDAKYIMVVFGGACGYQEDDLSKFVWMPKIAHQTFANISADMYLPTEGAELIGPGMSPNMSRSMLLKFSYHNFGKFDFGREVPKGTDVVRYANVEGFNLKLEKFQEAFTSKNWIVRIHRVLPDPIWNRVY
jgi:dolichyl-diphosphooligosaccharide--protein glycosyltransferase